MNDARIPIYYHALNDVRAVWLDKTTGTPGKIDDTTPNIRTPTTPSPLTALSTICALMGSRPPPRPPS